MSVGVSVHVPVRRHAVPLRLSAALLALAMLGGCATVSGPNSFDKVREVRDASGPASAAALLEQSGGSDLLSQLEQGEMLRLAGRHQDSLKAFQSADATVVKWEEDARANLDRIAGMVLGSVVSERLTSYEGQDYEKVMLTVRMALGRMALGDWESARVDIRRTHEREDLIASLRDKEYAKVAEQSRTEKASSGFEPIKLSQVDGYPVKQIEDPRLGQLKNSYQNALSHYLAGFLYEALNEPSLAAPGYQKAAELAPGGRQALATLDRRVGRPVPGHTDVLFLVEYGEAPRLVAKAFAVPYGIGAKGNTQFFHMNIPYFEDVSGSPPVPQQLSVAGRSLKLEPIVDFGLMANRSLKDRMPGLLLRGFIRGAAKAKLRDKANEHSPLVGFGVTLATLVTEIPDDRTWRGLPQRVYIARAQIPSGEHRLRIDGIGDIEPIKVSGRHAVVPLRLFGRKAFGTGVALLGQPAALAVAEAAPSAGTSSAGAVADVTESMAPTSAGAAPAEGTPAGGRKSRPARK
ncbi:MAG: hypothetical protein RL654_2182 [Pseudomonadota bacterium]|jgi:hypothetical protein